MMKRFACVCVSLAMVLSCACAGAETVKKERVFAVTNAAGETQTIIDNIKLQGDDGVQELCDRTSLSNIENVGGHEQFTLDGESLVWQAEGNIIHYQGKGTAPLAVVPQVSFALDGETVEASALAAKNGELTMQVSYALNTTSPMPVFTVMIVPAGMTEITLENALLMDEGGKQIIIGYAFPGVDEALALPTGFTVKCNADHVQLGWMMTFASNQPLSAFVSGADEQVGKLDTLAQNMTAMLTALKDGTEMPAFEGELGEIATGIQSLITGAAALKDGAATLSTGAASLDEGAAALESGLTTLTANNEALNAGATQLFEAILTTANQQLAAAGLDAAGLNLPALTPENYAEVLDAAVAQLNGMMEQGKAAAEAQVRAAVMAQETAIREGVNQVVRAQVLEQVLAASGLEMKAEDYAAAVKAGKVGEAQAAQIDAAVNAQMETEAVKAAAEQAVNSKIEELVSANLASEEVQNALRQQLAVAEAAITSLTSLKAQLDQVNAFVSGLAAYTEGVSQVQEGCVTLHSGTTQLAAGAAALSEGAGQLSDGLTEAAGKAADQLLPYLTGDVQTYIQAFNSMKESVSAASGYDLIPEGWRSETVYIIRTDMK